MRLQTTSTTSTETGTPGRLVWPDAVAFREAIQNPGVALGDPDLKNAEVVTDKRGLPVAYSGRFAVVFRLRTRSGEEWALRCFTQNTGEDERRLRYTAVTRQAGNLPQHFVPFRYVEQGIRVGFQWYPVVAMRWARGETLGKFVENHVHDPQALRTLCLSLSDLLARLEAAGIAHGDWQHDNLLVSENGQTVTLVDYDGLFVPGLEGRLSPEIGHHNYQHPFRSAEHFGVGVDRFSHLVLQTALLALCKDPSLYARFSGDGESLLFKKADFLSPSRSLVFRAIAGVCGPGDVLLKEALTKLEAACVAGPAGVILPDGPGGAPAFTSATLGAFSPGRNGPAAPPPLASPSKWWMTGNEAAPRLSPASASMSTGVLLAGGQGMLLQQQQHEANLQAGAGFISRLATDEILMGERKNLYWTRAAWVVCLALFAFFFLIEGRMSTFPWIILFQLVFLPYNAWPRKKVNDELSGEIKKLENLLSERYVRVAELKDTSPHLLAPGMKPGDASHFIQHRLGRTNARSVLSIPGITEITLERLRAAGIHTAADLQGRTFVYGVSLHEFAALQNWVREQEMLAADEYRQSAPTHQQTRKDVARLENEIAGFETELEKLRLEQENFPDVSPGAFFRKVVGAK